MAAALLVPATLGLLSSAYPAGPESDRAVSVWGTTGAVGLALGVTVGGGILAVASWQWIFWINIPIVALCLLAAGNAVRSTTSGARLPSPPPPPSPRALPSWPSSWPSRNSPALSPPSPSQPPH